jgi:quercetin dioxygenase-like cupin family protein
MTVEERVQELSQKIGEKVEQINMAQLNSITSTPISKYGGIQQIIATDINSTLIRISMKAGETIPMHHHGTTERTEVLIITSGRIAFGEEGDVVEISVGKAVDATKIHGARCIEDMTGFVIFIPKL